ncbi:A/G-specific adenine glycosylase [Kwoniella dendrophila CBS 6074]|uniref:Adenine DNA glycosylase n=1 Tax=Kwoniella dendrophila CBS 6074 TaxID=1295534 RepID=A0AAX4JW63_9TREE
MRASLSRSPSILSIPDSDGSDYQPTKVERDISPKKSSVKRKRIATTTIKTKTETKSVVKRNSTAVRGESDLEDIEDSVSGGPSIHRDHDLEYHDVEKIAEVQEDLLSWFEDCREKRGMPWRKKYDPNLTMEEKGQRAYEIWVSEVMLQQTQVATVIAYWKRWIEKWPTIADLAKADVEEVNAMWRGLGYYRRARSLLAGAKTVMSKSKYKGRLPDDPVILEKEIDGVGRYTAGAICSMAYGVRTPIVDGNIHRLFTRLLALHAPQTAPTTIKFLWSSAEQLIGTLPTDANRKGIAGDWNQALMELGSQVCKPTSPDCQICPIKSSCKAYSEISKSPPEPTTSSCPLCSPIPSSSNSSKSHIPNVTIFPMKKEKKASRDEEESVLVVEWKGENGDRKWLMIKRPEKGLLAGLFEPPTTPTSSSSTTTKDWLQDSLTALQDYITIPSDLDQLKEIGEYQFISSIPHIFSHINMTYHIHHLIIQSSSLYPLEPPSILPNTPRITVWLNQEEIVHSNIGTGVKKVWSELYGSWGSFDRGSASSTLSKKSNKKVKIANNQKQKQPLAETEMQNGKLVLKQKIMMPAMPIQKVKQ